MIWKLAIFFIAIGVAKLIYAYIKNRWTLHRTERKMRTYVVHYESQYHIGFRTVIAEDIRNQLQEDVMNDQLSLKEFVDPFAGEKSK